MPFVRILLGVLLIVAITGSSSAQVLDKQKQLESQTFWDNRDWDWYAEQIPFFECPDAEITTTYYYRWELLTKHLTYGSVNSGYSLTGRFGPARMERLVVRPGISSTKLGGCDSRLLLVIICGIGFEHRVLSPVIIRRG